jgi:hypothetical protein
MTDNQFFRNMDKPTLLFSALAETYFNMYGFGNWYGRRGGLAGEDVTGGMEFFGSGTLRVGVDSKFGLVGGDMNITLPTFITVEAKAIEKEGKTKELVAGVSEFKSRAVANVSSSIASLRANVSEEQANATETGGQTGEAIIGAATADKGAVDLKNPGAPVPSPPTGAALVAAAAGAQEAATAASKAASDAAGAGADDAVDAGADAARNASNNAAGALDELDQAKAGLDEATSNLSKANGELDQAKAGVEEATSNLSKATEELDQAKAGFDEATSNLSKATEELDNLKQARDGQLEQLDNLNKELDAAIANGDTAAREALTKQADELKIAINEASANINVKQIEVDGFADDLTLASNDVMFKQAEVDASTADLATAKSNVVAKQAEVDGFANDLTLASNDVMFKQAEYDSAVEAAEAAQKNLDEALAAADAAANAQKLADDLFKQISENYEDLGDAWLSNALKIDDFGLDFKTLSELFTNPIFGRDDAIAEFVGYYKYDYADGSWDGNNDVDSFSTTYTVGATNPNTGETAFAEQAPADQTQRRGPDVQPDGTTVLYWGFS